MITIISGTNRKDSLTKAFAEKYREIISKQTQKKVRFLALEDLSHDWFSDKMYEDEELSENLVGIQEEYILPANSFVVFSPEYNGSYPGVLKMFIDACSVRKYKQNFKTKKVALVGIADGRAGNLRGMGHLAAVFNHLGAITFPNQLPISKISTLMDEKGQITDKMALEVMSDHAKEFLKFAG